MSARREILARVRDAIAGNGHDGLVADGGAVPAPVEIPQRYRTRIDAGIDTFIARLGHYQAKARRVAASDVDAAVRTALSERGARRVVAPDGVPEAWLEGIEPLRDAPPLDARALDESHGIVSTCAVAIAETGTIVLDGSEGMGRRILSLIPDYHLCVVRAEQVVGSVPEAIARLDPVRPITFISGPSATVDIELVRVGGVHGPRTLEVIIAG